jgi:uncharacterized peroxidase-related enzyme
MTMQPLSVSTADPRTRELMEKVRRQSVIIPNLYRYMANSPGALDTYLHGYETFRARSGFTPAEQEVIFLTISFENACDYCMAAHSFLADTRSHVPPGVTEAIRNGTEVPDARLRALSEFTRAMLLSRGRPTAEEASSFLAAGYSERQILEIILAISIKTISNYTNHVFNTPIDLPFKAREWRGFRALARLARRVGRAED